MNNILSVYRERIDRFSSRVSRIKPFRNAVTAARLLSFVALIWFAYRYFWSGYDWIYLVAGIAVLVLFFALVVLDSKITGRIDFLEALKTATIVA